MMIAQATWNKGAMIMTATDTDVPIRRKRIMSSEGVPTLAELTAQQRAIMRANADPAKRTTEQLLGAVRRLREIERQMTAAQRRDYGRLIGELRSKAPDAGATDRRRATHKTIGGALGTIDDADTPMTSGNTTRFLRDLGIEG